MKKIFICLVFVVFLCGCASNQNGYLKKGEWASLSNYMFAVENDDFDGDIYEAGTYRFYPDLVDRIDSIYSSETPIVWDIYVSNNLYNNSSELQESEYVASVGGLTKIEETITLEKGQYVYINYNEVLGEPAGILKIEKE